MAAVLQRNKVEMKVTGKTVTIPDNPRAKLMYYFDCMCTVLDLQDSEVSQLRDFRNYYLLEDEDLDKLLIFCSLLEPRTLNGKCIFLNNDMDSNNEFLELSAVTTNLAFTETILIGGVQRKVQRIMLFRTAWMEKYFLEPYQYFAPRLLHLLSDGNGNDAPAKVGSGTALPALEAPPPQRTQNTYTPPVRPVSTSSDDDSCCCVIL